MKIDATLWDLTRDQIEMMEMIEAAVEDNHGEVDDRIEEMIDELTAGEEDISKKMAGYLAVIDNLDAQAKALKGSADSIKETMDRLKRRAEMKQNTIDAMKSRMLSAMDVLGMKKIETPLGNITAANKAQPDVIYDEAVTDKEDAMADLALLLPEFVRTKHSIDKKAVLDYLKDGGTLTFAKLGERGKYIRIS